MTERLLDGVGAALGVSSRWPSSCPTDDGAFAIFRSHAAVRRARGRVACRRAGAARAALSRRRAGQRGGDRRGLPRGRGRWTCAYYFPCRVKGEVIAVLGVGRKDGFDPLNSEEVDLLQALAGQAATAFMNGRLYRSLREKADELQRLTEYNENILESMDSGILVLDLDGRVARWNRAMESLYGQRREEVARAARSTRSSRRRSWRRCAAAWCSGDHEEIAHIYKLHLPTADGRSLMVNVSVAPFQVGSGERCGTILILEDVTARVRLEEQLQHSEKMASIGLLAAGVAHEVNTPLTGISSYTQMLREQVPGNGPGGAAAREDREADLPRRQDHQQPAELLALRQRRAGVARREQARARRALAARAPARQGAHQGAQGAGRGACREVRGNENRLQQVFFNLILNARDAMPSGGWLTLATTRRRRHGDRRGDATPATASSARTSSASTTRSSPPRASAAAPASGLSVSYGIVQEHGGAIFVDSAPGQGTTFQVALPALRPAEAVRGAMTAPESLGTILVVDDEEVMRDVLQTLLTPGRLRRSPGRGRRGGPGPGPQAGLRRRRSWT